MKRIIVRRSKLGNVSVLRMPAEQNSKRRIGLLALVFAISGWPALAAIAGDNSPLVNFDNPVPQASAEFGNAVAPVGSSQVVIGAWKAHGGAGAAYLFRTDGTLVCSMTNPSPPSPTIPQFNTVNFGMAVAGLGADRVIVGAPNQNVRTNADGAAYLFAADGTVLTILTNPAPVNQSQFGRCVAAAGGDKILVSAPLATAAGVIWSGAVYLFSTNGTLLHTFNRPGSFGFGMALDTLDAERVIIGIGGTNGLSSEGAAQLFHLNGSPLATLANPAAPGASFDRFGWSVAGSGGDKILIGAVRRAGSIGQSYLFDTNALLLTTFTNPTPNANDAFGRTLTAVGPDKVAVAAHLDDTGSSDGGVVHIFNLHGELLETILNPAPRGQDNFGYGLAAVGSDQIVAGAICRSGAAGTAHLFRVGPAVPPLSVTCLPGGDMCVSWPAPAAGFVLEATETIASSANWGQVPYPYQTNNGRISIVAGPSVRQFYRLRK